MDKICKELEVDFEHFLEDKQVNKVKNNHGTMAYQIDTVNQISEKLIAQYEIRIEELKQTILELKVNSNK